MKRQLLMLAVILFSVVPVVCPAQAAVASSLSFDVASVHQNKSGLPPSGDEPNTNVPLGPGDVYTPTGGLFSVRNYPFLQFIAFAYKLTSDQVKAVADSAPEWVAQDRFNLQARTDRPNVTKDEIRLMMRSLLADRFRLAVHYEAKTTAVFGMKLIKPGVPGPRLRPHPQDSCSHAVPKETKEAEPPPDAIDGGFPTTCGGLLMLPSSTMAEFQIGARDVPITLISNAMPSWGGLDRPVVDETGLTGSYDFALSFVPQHPDPPPGTPAPAEERTPNFLEAVRKQLGLKLENERREVPVLIMDHVEHLRDE